MDTISLAVSFIGVGVIVTFTLIAYIHRNFVPKENFNPEKFVLKETFHIFRSDTEKQNGEIKEFMHKLDDKMDRLLERFHGGE